MHIYIYNAKTKKKNGPGNFFYLTLAGKSLVNTDQVETRSLLILKVFSLLKLGQN